MGAIGKAHVESSGLEVMAAGSGGLWCQYAVVPRNISRLKLGGGGIGRGRLATKRRAERAEAKFGYC